MRIDLVNTKDNFIIAYYDVEEQDRYRVSGELHKVIAWSETGSPFSTLFFADATIKWDGCSHFWFHGESHKMTNPLHSEEIEDDSYYHVCGLHSYLDFLRVMLFAYEVMIHFVGYDSIDEKKEIQELRNLGVLNGYEIKYPGTA